MPQSKNERARQNGRVITNNVRESIGFGKPEDPQPRNGNTRLNSHEEGLREEVLGIDWLDFRGLLCPSKIVDLFDWVAYHCDDAIDWENDHPTGRHVKFSHGFRSVRGAIYACEHTDGASKIWISLPGKALAGCGSTMAQLFIAARCLELGFRCTRLDLYLDDSSGTVARVRQAIKAAYKRGEHSGFRKLTKYTTYDAWGEAPEHCLYLGSRESASYPRIYDKGDKVRWERQTMRTIAHQILEELVNVHEQLRKTVSIPLYDSTMARAIACHLTNGIDFIIRKGKNLDRSKRSRFWSKFLLWLGEVQVKTVRHAIASTMEKTLAWLDRQVSKSFVMVRDILGSGFAQWFSAFEGSGRSRYRSFDLKRIEAFREGSRGSVVV